jgi:hypothetical protein
MWVEEIEWCIVSVGVSSYRVRSRSVAEYCNDQNTGVPLLQTRMLERNALSQSVVAIKGQLCKM